MKFYFKETNISNSKKGNSVTEGRDMQPTGYMALSLPWTC